ncbi:MAG: ABC transporter ATP-binding protein [Christensenellaceae bacterium]|jgi:putative ABC transport system ATP-binding protein|nr:ABC transporter ATP-binding protein [Christensenellaceae bacterium]
MNVKVDNICKSFKDKVVLKNTNMFISNASFFGIKGSSGCGKSTLLNIIGLLDKPDSGNLYFDDIAINFKCQSKLAFFRGNKIGFIFQSYNLMPKLTVYENIMLPFMYLDKNKFNSSLFDRLIEIFDIKELLGKQSDVLSGGEKQRVAATRALITSPELVICDEPTGNLDSNNAKYMMELLKEFCKFEKKTIIMVTHSNEYDSFFDDIYVFDEVK